VPAHTAYGYDLELSLGIGRQAGAGVWDAGTWDQSVWAQTDTALGDWVDVTCDVVAPFTLAAGSSNADGITLRWEAASTAFTLDGDQWNPWTGPYADLLGPELGVRWRWRLTGDVDWSPLFYGRTIDGGWSWDPGTGRADVTASDFTSDLATFVSGKLPAPVGAGETGAQRVTRILDLARWPVDRRQITAGGQALVATDMSGKAWENLLDVGDTDLALLAVDRAGRLVYKPNGRANVPMLTGVLVACPAPAYPDAVQVIDMGRTETVPVVNIAQVRGGTPPGGTDPAYATSTDEGSVSRYRAHATTWDLEHDVTVAPTWSATVAQLVVASKAWPSPAPHELTLGLASGDMRVPAVLFMLEPGQAFRVLDPGGRVWIEQVGGWDVQIGWDTCAGQLFVTDVTRWAGAMWDSATWDIDRWTL
jgi:hypothetical protein